MTNRPKYTWKGGLRVKGRKGSLCVGFPDAMYSNSWIIRVFRSHRKMVCSTHQLQRIHVIPWPENPRVPANVCALEPLRGRVTASVSFSLLPLQIILSRHSRAEFVWVHSPFQLASCQTERSRSLCRRTHIQADQRWLLILAGDSWLWHTP